MQIILVIFLILILAGFGLIFYLINKKFQEIKEGPKNDQSFLLLQNQLNELTRAVDAKLSETHKTMAEQVGASNKIIKEVTEKLTKLDETNKQVIGFTEQLQNLEDILKNPKQRGVLGEYYLETVLKNVLPPGSYEMQYKFKDGTIVDAAVFVKDKIIPIDSKFSLENYNRIAAESDPVEREKLEKVFKQDLKNRIDETSKYIKPAERTMDFAFMFIPAEAIYYDLLVNQVGVMKISTRDLIEYAFREKHVIIVSPTSFLAYLQTVLQGLRALQIEETAKEIRERIEELHKHLISYDSYMQKLGNNLGTTVNMYNQAYKEFKKVDKDVVKIAGGESQIEALQIDKPETE
jgi:DNA recombination protein RmuC